jgi:hypothetical protein
MKRLMTICAAVGLIMAVAGTAQADLDINGIYMDSWQENHWNGTPETKWGFETSVDFDDTDSLHHINVTKPGDSTPSITITYEGGWWGYESPKYSTLTDLQGNYPTGDYKFELRDSSNGLLRSVTLDYSGISWPTEAVNFIYPSTNGQPGIDINPTFTWTVSPTAGDVLGMLVENENRLYENAPVSMTTTSWAPGPLLPGHDYGLEVSVLNVKDIESGPVLPTMTVDSDTFTYGLLMECGNDIRFTTAPEPATLSLLVLGGLAVVRRRKTKSSIPLN